MTTLGFVGLGLMGVPMCRRLLAAGHPLTVWNRSAAKADSLRAAGATVAANLGELVRDSDIIMLCLANDEAVQAVWQAEDGIRAQLRPGQLLVDFSSTSPALTRQLAQQAAEHGAAWVDAPVSGGVRGAENGTLVIMAGGLAQDIARLQPIAGCLSQRLSHIGSHGAGQVAKVCNQLIVASNAMLIAETVQLAEAAGIDASLLPAALAGGFADSLPFQILAPRMAQRQYLPLQWKVATLLKDLGNARQLAAEHDATLPLASLAADMMARHAAAGYAEQDLSTVIACYQADGEAH